MVSKNIKIKFLNFLMISYIESFCKRCDIKVDQNTLNVNPQRVNMISITFNVFSFKEKKTFVTPLKA